MSDPVQSPGLVDGIGLETLGTWIEDRRWYASKSRHISSIEVDECARVADQPPLRLLLVETKFASGSHELYQLPLTFMPASEAEGRTVVGTTGELVAVDAVADPDLMRDLLRRVEEDFSLDTEEGQFRFRHVPESGPLMSDAPARPIGVEQSNSSIVFGDETVLKVFRRLEPGINPELELLQFLTGHEYQNIAPLLGWYEYEGRSFSATLGVAQRFFADATGGWELALDQIGSDPEGLLNELGGLGAVTAQLHNVLASDANDPAFTPVEAINSRP